MPAIFLSHATKNDAEVTQIHDALEKLTGVEIWVDHKDIRNGENWDKTIERAVSDCPYMLLIISRDSMKSDEVHAEWRAAITYGHALLLAIIDDIPIEDIPQRLRLHQWVNLSTDWDAGIAKIAASIRGEKTDSAPAFTPWPIITRSPISRKLTGIAMQGRDDDLNAVQRLVKLGPTQIIGIGGLGKSRLAVEIMLRLDDVGGAVWHVCSDVSRPDEVIELLRDHFGLDVTAERTIVLNQLRRHRRLIVFDNAESVPEGHPHRKIYAELIEALIAHGSFVLLTTRVIWNEISPPRRKYQPSQLTLEAARQVAIEMLTAFGLEGLEASVLEIAKAARLHPKLIEWAVGQVENRGVTRVLADLDDLKSKNVQEALDEMIHKTLRQMEAKEAGEAAVWALRRLNACRGGFTYDAAKALCILSPFSDDTVGMGLRPTLTTPITNTDDLDTALHLLQTYRFVTFATHVERYDVDPLVQEIIGAEGFDAHYDYYGTLAWQHREKQDYAHLDIESANLEVAFERMFDVDAFEQVFALYTACSDFLSNRRRAEQRKEWLERVAPKLLIHPDKYIVGAVHDALGSLYAQRPTGELKKNLQFAIYNYQQALIYADLHKNPQSYAVTQLNLGSAWRQLSEIENATGNLHQAIEAYEEALIYFTSQIAPQTYAKIQYGLGNVYRHLSAFEDRADNLHRAITACKHALDYLTPDVNPLDYAATQNNLGATYADLANVEERLDNLLRSVEAYEKALRYYTSEAAPLEYAKAQLNLGSAYLGLSTIQNDNINLRHGINSFAKALIYFIPEKNPLFYARTQHNLGIAHKLSNTHDLAILCWREAEHYYRQTGYIEDADKMLRLISEVGESS